MRRWVPSFLIAAFMLLANSPLHAEKRVALTIGNSTYKNATQLPNPANDAVAVAALLRSAGFDVVESRGDLGIAEMRRALRQFSDVAADADIAVVFYAGHGMEVDGVNYLIPIDATLERDLDAEDEAIPLDRVLKVIDQAKRLRLVILDACRDNPFARTMKRTLASRAIGRGLAKVEPQSSDTLVAFAAKAGSTASDGDGTNSPFTAALLQFIASPGLDVRLAFGRVRDEVLRSTGNRQEPFVYGSLGGSIIALVPGNDKQAEPAARQPDQASIEIAFWETIKNEKNPLLFEAYLKRYPSGAFADLARINLQQQKTASANSTVEQPDDKLAIGDAGLLREMRERLYALNFDPGPMEGPFNPAARDAIREFERRSNLPQTGQATQGLLRILRETGSLGPWGAIVYSRSSGNWGMAWSHETRKAAVAAAQQSCGTASCPVEISFFGTECGVFAHSGSSWAIVTRDTIQKARDDALADCGKKGRTCRIVASVCADGAERVQAQR
ncbi:caspase family protein [Bradyrhizobium sp.]|uniref:caspase family protein n=1 Tax=Bradyrhizobium sp. TaxID=376 RepID=UPI00238D2D39|nr:caspase family protein [Bradyrhizobium sp.]MDE2379278.1 caspase family protein [Bradyrhizobium sp.]